MVIIMKRLLERHYGVGLMYVKAFVVMKWMYVSFHFGAHVLHDVKYIHTYSKNLPLLKGNMM